MTATDTPGGTRQVLGTCHHDCPDSCGWVATVDGAGIAVKLRGNPDHPYSQGELCPKVNRFLDRVYSPDRITTPLIRTGAKGAGEFRPATWDEALALVAQRVGAAVDTHGGETVLPWGDAGTQGLLQCSSLDRRFFARLGSSRQTGSLCGATAGAGMAETYGSRLGADPLDIAHSKLAILWATNTKLTNRHLWPWVEQARANGAHLVVIDPFRTVTAEAADVFLQPRPGTDVALMLAMMHVLIRDDLVDHDYVARHASGFDELAAHVADWTPERAAAECGVPADDIERLAIAYGTTRPAFIRTLIGAEHHTNGAMFFRALACLPVLTGSWRERGGGVARSVGSWAEGEVDDSVYDTPNLSGGRPRRGINMNELGRALTDDTLEPPVTALFVWNGNPVVTVPRADLIRAGLERDDLFCVVSEQFMTDTARYADVVFPATTQLEQTDVVPSWGHLWLGWNEAAIEPVGESVPNTELWRRLAAAMGYDEPELFESDESLLRAAMPTVDLDALRAQGWKRLDLPDPLLPYADGGFATPDGRAALLNPAMAERGLPTLPTYVAPGVRSGAATTAVAPGAGDHGTAVDGAAPELPLVLHTPKYHTRFLNSSYSHLPAHGPREGGPWCEITAVDAAARGIADGDVVEVRSAAAALRVAARIGDRVQPGMVAVPFGWWGDQHPDHPGSAATVNSLTTDAPTDWGGGVAYGDTRVEVVRV